jgi:hypothetical protein
MAGVVFDHTRVISALGQASSQSPPKPHLVLWDLAKMVEAIVLYESIWGTEQIDLQYEKGWLRQQKSFFDLGRSYIYDPIFLNVFKRPLLESTKAADEWDQSLPRSEFRGRSVLTADLAVFPEVALLASEDDFQFLHETRLSDDLIFLSLERIRVLNRLASHLGVPYDPALFRVPLAKRIAPGNITEMHLHAYRKFERDVHEYLEDLCGGAAIKIPLMLAIVLREVSPGCPDDIFANALQLRGDPLILRLREILNEHLVARQTLNLGVIAKTSRILKDEMDRARARLSGVIAPSLELTLKPGLFPIDLGFDVKRILQRLRDRDQYPALTNLSRLTEETMRVWLSMKEKIESILPIEVPNTAFLRS